MHNAPRNTSWHGTPEEAADLLKAIENHCECEPGQGVTNVVCAAHTMLVREQHTMDRLLFARRIVSRLRNEEFHPAAA